MSLHSGTGGGPATRAAARRLALHALVYAAIWGILTDGRAWLVGLPAILLAAALSCLAPPSPRWSLTALLAFVPYFAWISLRGGIDVAWRAVHPRLPIEPALIPYRLALGSAPGRVLMTNAVTLLPGTLSADLRGGVLHVHVLNATGDYLDGLKDLERRIARICEPDRPAADTPA